VKGLILHWGSDKQGVGCDVVHGAENSKHLLELPGASDRLKLFVAELMEPGCFDNVVEGCDGVFHTASPVLFKDIADPQAEVIDPAVIGTLNVLASCAKAQTKKVVFTSSISAIIFTNKRNSTGGIDESLWSDEDYCRENKMWYFLSKTLAEKAAWNFANEKGLNMVAIQPVTVLGPPLQASPNYGLGVIRDYLNGKTPLHVSLL
jgi:nucleoside-diphosphate-sugar epimerase